MAPRTAFQGSRAQFMLEAKDEYAAGVMSGYAKDAIARIQRKYLKRYPIELPHTIEPSTEHLASVDDDEPDDEPQPPNPEVLREDEYESQLAAFEERRRLIIFRKAQIQRRLAYQYGRDHEMDPKESGAMAAHRILLHKLTGEGIQKPRLKTASNIWRRSHREEIEAEAKKRAGKLTGRELRKRLAALREKVAKELYARLSDNEKNDWKNIAQEEHEEALVAFNETVNGPPSEAPEDRQRVIQNLAQFVQPVLDLICEATGFKASLIAGGPEPADEGRLNIVSFHSGTTKGEIKMNFGRSEQMNYQKYLTPMYHNFLRKCYSLEECRARALPSCEGYEGLEAALEDNEHDATVFRGPSIEPASTPTSTTQPPPSTAHGAPPASPSHSRTPNPACSRPQTPTRSRSPTPARSRSPTPARSRSPTPTRSRSPTPAPARSPTPPLPRSPTPPVPRSPTPLAPRSPTLAGSLSATLPVNKGCADLLSSAFPASDIPGGCSPMDVDAQLANPGKPDEAATGVPKRPIGEVEGGDREVGASLRPVKRTKTHAAVHVPTAAKQTSPPKASTLPPPPKTSAGPASASLVPPTKATAVPSPSPPARPKSSAVPSSSVLPPKWFNQSLDFFAGGSSALKFKPSDVLGPEWTDLLVKWSDFEKRSAYKENGRLSAKSRPSVISEWIKNARSDKWLPKPFNPKLYGNNFASWWLSLQPQWRVRDGHVVEGLVEGDWGTLKISGVNGILSVVAALFFWGINVFNDQNNVAEWKSAVVALAGVLPHL